MGAAAKLWKRGDKVCALVNGGGYAEYCAVAETQALPVPARPSMVEAASLPEACFTVWGNVYDRGRSRPARRSLCRAALRASGSRRSRLAAASGNRVFATAGSDEKVAACVKLGAEKAFNYKDAGLGRGAARCDRRRRREPDPRHGRRRLRARELKCLAEEGRLVFIAYLRGPKTELDIDSVMRRRLTLTGSTLRPRSGGVQGLYREEPAGEGLAADRSSAHQAAGVQDLSARAGGRGPFG